MKNTVLIVGRDKSAYLRDLEDRVFTSGFKTLFVANSLDALDKLERELFSVIIYDLACEEADKLNFVQNVWKIPFGAVTPLVLVKDPDRQFDSEKLICAMDKVFAKDKPADLILNYVKETVDLARKKIKKGSLAFSPVSRVLFDAHVFRFTGAVIFEKGGDKKIIYFENGSVIFASSNIQSERFGEFMVMQGLISKEQLAQALDYSKKSSMRFGQILVEMGYVKPDSLAALLNAQIKHILFSIFGWEEGDFFILFEETAQVKDLPAKFVVPSLIMEGIRKKFTTSDLLRLLSPLSREVLLDRKWKYVSSDFQFTEQEAGFLSSIKEKTTIEQLLKTERLTEYEALRLIQLLVAIGVLKIRTEGEVIVAEVMGSSKAVVEEKTLKKTVMEEPKHIDDLKKDFPKPKEQVLSKSEVAPAPVMATAVKKPVKTRKKIGLAWKIGASALGFIIFFAIALYVYLGYEFKSPQPKVEESPVAKVIKEEPKIAPSPTPIATKMIEATVQQPLETAKAAEAKDKVVPEVKQQTPIAQATKVEVPKIETPKATAGVDNGALFFSHLTAGRKYYSQGNLEKSLSEYEKSYAINRKNDALLVEIGQVLFELNRSVEAIEKYKEAIRINPRNSKAHLNLGSVYQIHGKDQLAVNEYKKFLEIVPDDPYALEVKRIVGSLEKKGNQ
jgi:hypothetical protein